MNPEGERLLREAQRRRVQQQKAQFLDGDASWPTEGVAQPAATNWPSCVIEHDKFPKAFVNRMWGHFFGRASSTRSTTSTTRTTVDTPSCSTSWPTTFKHYNYDLKKLIRWICNSNAYNLSCVANKTNDKPEHEAAVQPHAAQVDEARAAVRVADGRHRGRGRRRARTSKKDCASKWLDKLIAQLRRRRGQRGQLQRHRRAGADDDERQGHQRGHRRKDKGTLPAC